VQYNTFLMPFRPLLLSLVLLVLTTTAALAAEHEDPFATSVHTTYTVSLSGNTTVSHEFSLKNKTATSYVSQYAIKSPLKNLTKIAAETNSQPVQTEVTESENGTTIVLTFDDQVVGENKTRKFTLSYGSADTAIISGNVLELYVPSIADEQQYEKRSVTLKTPLKFGRATQITPEPEAVSFTTSTAVTNFPDLGKRGVVALFGDTQFFSLTLRYNLENSSSAPGITQIALPPDTPYQKMQYHSLDPAPNKLHLDQDGNWIATYEVGPSSAVAVYLTAAAQVHLWPSPEIPQPTVLASHTQKQKYWEIDEPAVLDVAKNIQTPQAIYDYVVSTLTYNLPGGSDPFPRKGALAALADPGNAVCQEFTDVFIALARANNIPARRVTGYGFNSNSQLRPLSLQTDILHAWAEYFDSQRQQWRQVDPTWGNTTGGGDYFSQFDLNHITFAINGVSSVTPYAAGSYKSNSFQSKDVEVELLDQFVPFEPDFTISLEDRRIFGIALPGLYTINITNNTGQAWYGLSASITTNSTNDEIAVNATNTEDTILPFQTLALPLLITSDQVQLPQTTQLLVTLSLENDYNTTKTFDGAQTGLALYHYLNETTITLILVGSFTIGTLVTGSLLVFRRRR